jgi:hypothetical protein
MTRTTASRSRRGQTLVEFALLLPLLIVLFLGIADFGRVFSDGLILEAAARDGAEVAAQEYVQLSRSRPGNVLTAADYTHLHTIALEAVCEEATKLTNPVMAGGSCSMPHAAVCVHEEPPDGSGDPLCGTEASGAPTECDRVIGPPAWDSQIEPGQSADVDHPALPYVEVRLCYRFTTIFNLTDLQLPLANGLNIGEIWLQRDRVFVVGDY